MADTHDPAALERARRYNRTREWLTLVDLVWDLAWNLLALETGLSARLRAWARRLAPSRLGPVMLYGAMSTLLSFVASLPLSYYGGYVVEHRYELSNQTRRAWFLEDLKALGIQLAIGLLLMQGAYWVIGKWRSAWWAILSALTVPLSVVFAVLGPVLIMPLFNRFEPVKDKKLVKRITNLAGGEGVRVSEVLQMDMSKQTKKANAAFTGLGRTKRIVVADTLLDEFSDDEIEVVLAHELGHQVHRDIWKLIALAAPTTLVGLAAARFGSPPLLRRFGTRWDLDAEDGAADLAALPLLMLVARAAFLLVTPVLNAISRNLVEHRADVYALHLTRKRGAFIGAMEKLGRMNLADPKPPAIVKYLLYSHPPVQERIDFARKYPFGS